MHTGVKYDKVSIRCASSHVQDWIFLTGTLCLALHRYDSAILVQAVGSRECVRAHAVGPRQGGSRAVHWRKPYFCGLDGDGFSLTG